MSDSMKTRPISEISWNRFVLLNSLLDYWNLLSLSILIPVAFLLIPLEEAVLSSLLFFSVFWLNGYAVTVYRLAQGWEYKAPVLLVGFFWVPVVACYVLNPLSLPWAQHVAGFILLCMLMIYGFYKYSCTLHCYADYSRSTGKTYSTHFSWISMEYISMMRATRYRLEDLDSRLEEYRQMMHDEILGTGKQIRHFSEGNQQKIGIIAAMMINPMVLVLDEPFNYLDPSSQIIVAELLKQMNERQGTTVVVSSHNLAYITDVATRILLLEKGKIIKDVPNRNGSALDELKSYFASTE